MFTSFKGKVRHPLWKGKVLRNVSLFFFSRHFEVFIVKLNVFSSCFSSKTRRPPIHDVTDVDHVAYVLLKAYRDSKFYRLLHSQANKYTWTSQGHSCTGLEDDSVMTPNDIRLYLGRSKYIKNLPLLRPSASAIPLRWSTVVAKWIVGFPWLIMTSSPDLGYCIVFARRSLYSYSVPAVEVYK